MGADASKMKLRDPDEAILDAEIGCALYPTTKAAGHVQTLRNQLQEIMWDDVGVMRTSQGMTRGLDRLDALENELMETGVDGTNLAFNLTWHDWLNMRSLLDISKAITIAGLKRENSRGAHFREDFPDEGDLETSQFTVARLENDEITVENHPVEFSIVKPGETILPEGEPESLVEIA